MSYFFTSVILQRRLLISHVSFRPLTVSTEEYGAMWLDFSHDTKQKLTLGSDGRESLADTLNVLKKKLNLHVVEIIGEQTLSSNFKCKSSAFRHLFIVVTSPRRHMFPSHNNIRIY